MDDFESNPLFPLHDETLDKSLPLQDETLAEGLTSLFAHQGTINECLFFTLSLDLDLILEGYI